MNDFLNVKAHTQILYIFIIIFSLFISSFHSNFICGFNKLPKEKFCNSHKDCPDGSDEFCKSPCNKDFYQCQSTNLCIPRYWLCDGKSDCQFGDDEDFDVCKKHKCNADQFLCHDGLRCISEQDLCNGVVNCLDRSDEREETCPVLESIKCPPDRIMCKDKTCKTLDHVCEAIEACLSGEGSLIMETKKKCLAKAKESCNSDEVLCDDGKGCFRYIDKCNGINNCKDGSDEKGCRQVGSCGRNQFFCGIGQSPKCIPSQLLCDGVNNCDNGLDEANCEVNYNEKKCTSETGFWCEFEEKCLSNHLLCNGSIDCADGSDELNCGEDVKVCDANSEIQCESDKFCLPLESLCERSKYKDKIDSCILALKILQTDDMSLHKATRNFTSLQDFCMNDACISNDCPTDSQCVNHHTLFTCSCGPYHKYKKMDGKSVCDPINVCKRHIESNRHRLCDHFCDQNDVNLPICRCLENFKLSPKDSLNSDYQKCSAISGNNFALITNDKVYVVHLNDENKDLSRVYELITKEELKVERILSATLEWSEEFKLLYIGHSKPNGISIVPLKSTDDEITRRPVENADCYNREKLTTGVKNKSYLRLNRIREIRPTRLAFDWPRYRIYFFDSIKETISLLDLRTGFIKTLMEMKNNLPIGMKIHSSAERIIWTRSTDYSTSVLTKAEKIIPGLFVSSLDSERKSKMDNKKIHIYPPNKRITLRSYQSPTKTFDRSSIDFFSSPGPLAIDPIDDRIIIADTIKGVIVSFSLFNSTLIDLLYTNSYSKLTHLLVWNDQILFIDQRTKFLYSIYKRNEGFHFPRIEKMLNLSQILFKESVNEFISLSYIENAQSRNEYFTCKKRYNLDCSHLCLPTEKFGFGRCACPDHLELAPDNKTCLTEKGIPDIIDESGTPENLKLFIALVFGSLVFALFLGIFLCILVAKKNSLSCDRKLLESKSAIYAPVIKVTKASDQSIETKGLSEIA